MLGLRWHCASEACIALQEATGRALQPGDDGMTAAEVCTANSALLALTFDMSGGTKGAKRL